MIVFRDLFPRLGFIFASTDEFLKDPKRGVASYEDLAQRLQVRSSFNIEGLKDFSRPVIDLRTFQVRDTYLLLQNIRNVFAYYDPTKYLIPDEGIEGFLNHCAKTLGADFYQTPREIV